jgi:hypothetical protein
MSTLNCTSMPRYGFRMMVLIYSFTASWAFIWARTQVQSKVIRSLNLKIGV